MWKSIICGVWSPWVAGVAIAFLFFIGLYVLDERPGTNDVYANLSDYSQGAIENKRISMDELPPWTWQTAFLVGILLGAFIASVAGKDWKLYLFPEDHMTKGAAYYSTFGLAMTFIGGVLTMAGLILAGESCLGLWNDCLALSVLSFFFIVVMFVEAVIVGTLLSLKVKEA